MQLLLACSSEEKSHSGTGVFHVEQRSRRSLFEPGHIQCDSTNALDMTEPLKSYLAGVCWPDAIPQLIEQHFQRIHSTARVVLHQFFPRHR